MLTIQTVLTQDHATLLAQLDQLAAEAGPEPGPAPRLLADCLALLRDHMRFEEKTLYPLLMLHVDASVLGARANAQHRELDFLVAKLDRAPGVDAPWPVQVSRLAAALRHHVAEEEATILPRLRRMMTDGMLRELATRYHAVRTPDLDGAPLVH